MTPTGRTARTVPAPRRLLAAVAVLAAAVVASLVTASPASAHDTLLSTDPAADSTVDTLPPELTLSYSGALIDEGEGATVVEVTSPSGASVVDGAPTVDGAVVTQALAPGEEAGDYSVLWRVVSSDGHPISGEYGFTVAEGGADDAASPAPSESDESDAPDAAGSTEAPGTTQEPSPAESPSTPPEVAGPATGTPSPLPWVLLGIVAAAVGGGLIYLLVRRARGTGDDTEGPADEQPGTDPER